MLRARNTTNLGTGIITLSDGTTLSSTDSAKTLTNNIVLAGNATLRTESLGTAATTTLSGVISETGGSRDLTITADSTHSITLSGNNSYTGATTVSTGMLIAAHANALGTSAGGVTVASGAALGLQGGITVAEAITGLAGTGVASGGALVNLSGSNTISGAVALTAAATVSTASSSTLTIGGALGWRAGPDQGRHRHADPVQHHQQDRRQADQRRHRLRRHPVGRRQQRADDRHGDAGRRHAQPDRHRRL